MLNLVANDKLWIAASFKQNGLGTLASATILTDPGNPINVLAKILRWLSTWASYVFRCQPKQVTEHRE